MLKQNGKMKYFDDMKDDEFRVIGQRNVLPKPFFRKKWFWIVMVLSLIAVAVVSLLTLKNFSKINKASMLSTSVVDSVVEKNNGPSAVLVWDTVINDVPLRILIPENAHAELMLGMPDTLDKSIVMAAQAADIRADNQKIVGAFVLKGEPISWGKAKAGFCAIVENRVYVGVAENTSLFEEATEKGGYFFRQYPLVSNGKMLDNKPKNKAIRHSLCELDGRIVMVSSHTKESFHDFAQALEDLGVRQAIYLTGAQSFGFCRPSSDSLLTWGSYEAQKQFENVNYIIWRAQSITTP